jgi:predicted dehydrogenase
MTDLSRRSFLEHTLAASAAGLAATVARGQDRPAEKATPAPRPRAAPNDRIGVAVIGLHGRGMEHLEAYSRDGGAEVVALCDIDQSTFPRAQQRLATNGRPEAKTYQDLRKLLEDKAVDAVSIATPNHWHALAGVWAMHAGKDVYVEKPVSHNVSEGRRLEEARVKNRRVCQAGTQARSSAAHREAIRYIHEGHIGRVTLARGLCYKRRKSIGHTDDAPVPDGVDYDIWLGPAPKRPFNPNRFHYNWHWNWDYGNGDIGNQGVHQVDVARWAMRAELPRSATCVGGRFGYEDDGQTPNTQLALFDYGESSPPLLFEVRGLETPPLRGVTIGDIIYGTEGFVAFGEEESRAAAAFDAEGKEVKSFTGGGDHFGDFLAAVRSRKQSDLACPVLEGHRSAVLCHLANISYRLGAPHPFEVPDRVFGDRIDAYEAFGRFEQHLADNALKLREMSYRLGPRLEFDPSAERFTSPGAANDLLTRDYREPFVMPTHV